MLLTNMKVLLFSNKKIILLLHTLGELHSLQINMTQGTIQWSNYYKVAFPKGCAFIWKLYYYYLWNFNKNWIKDKNGMVLNCWKVIKKHSIPDCALKGWTCTDFQPAWEGTVYRKGTTHTRFLPGLAVVLPSTLRMKNMLFSITVSCCGWKWSEESLCSLFLPIFCTPCVTLLPGTS